MKKISKDKQATVHWAAAKVEERLPSRKLIARQPLVVFLDPV